MKTTQLQAEIDRRQNNPTWFIRELVRDEHNLDNDDFQTATDWMDEPMRMEE